MADICKLNEWIIRSGLKKSFISKKMGITESCFSKKINGCRKFTLNELSVFKSIGMSNEEIIEFFLQ